MSELSPWPLHDAPPLDADRRCPFAHSWTHADIAESLAMPKGTLLEDALGPYCPACHFRPERDSAMP